MQKLFILIFALAFSAAVTAQNTEESANDDLDYYNQRSERDVELGNPWWFGTGAQLQFSSFNNTSFFLIGISPMAGYKVNNFLSFGPRASVAYNRYRDNRFNPELKEGFVTWSAGAFGRAQIFRGIFAHAEYSLVNEVVNFEQVGSTNDFEAVRTTRAIPYLGAGLNQGGGPGAAGFEILLLFRLTQPETINDSPYEFRTGINWNF